MIIDSQTSFVLPGAPLSMVGAAGVSPRSRVLDLAGVGAGLPPPNIIGTKTVFGEDTGIGMPRAQVAMAAGAAAFVTANAATLNVAFQGAQDTGAGGGYLPGAWQTFMETGPITAAQLVALAVFGRFDWPAEFPLGFQPRFLSLLFQIPAGTNFTVGQVAYAVTVLGRPDNANRYAAKNFTVAGP